MLMWKAVPAGTVCVMDIGTAGARVPGRWAPWTWAALVAVVVVHAVLAFTATALVALDTQGACHEPAAPGDLTQARVHLAVVVALSVGPWIPGILLAVRRRRHRAVLLLAATVVTSFPAWNLLGALLATPADWTMDWCLF